MKIHALKGATPLAGTATSQADIKKAKGFKSALEKAAKNKDKEGIKKVSQEFEAFFIRTVFKSMRQSSKWGEGLLEKSHGRKIYEQMMDEEFAKTISKGRGIGIGDKLYKQMLRSYKMDNDTK